jgi:hypothetical protein
MTFGDRSYQRGFGQMGGCWRGGCAGYDVARFANPVPGYGIHSGVRYDCRGWGRGKRHWYYATGLPSWARPGIPPLTPEQELSALKNAAELLKGDLDAIHQRIEELKHKE